jgi:hypothetical protein
MDLHSSLPELRHTLVVQEVVFGCSRENMSSRLMLIFFYPFHKRCKFYFDLEEWGEPVYYILLFLKILGSKLAKIVVTLRNLKTFR